jgi:predicted kinase
MLVRRRAIILCGCPTSGKSTWVKNNPGYTVISSDNIIEKYAKLKNSTYNDVFEDYVETAIQLMLGEMRAAIKQGDNIICDQTHLTPKVRKRKLGMIPDYYEKIAVYFELSMEEVLKRNKNSDRTKIIPHGVLESMHKSYKRPTINEGFVSVNDGRFFSCPLS